MKPSKKIAKKLARRGSGHESLLNTRNKRIYEGQYTPPGSRNPHKQG